MKPQLAALIRYNLRYEHVTFKDLKLSLAVERNEPLEAASVWSFSIDMNEGSSTGAFNLCSIFTHSLISALLVMKVADYIFDKIYNSKIKTCSFTFHPRHTGSMT